MTSHNINAGWGWGDASPLEVDREADVLSIEDYSRDYRATGWSDVEISPESSPRDGWEPRSDFSRQVSVSSFWGQKRQNTQEVVMEAGNYFDTEWYDQEYGPERSYRCNSWKELPSSSWRQNLQNRKEDHKSHVASYSRICRHQQRDNDRGLMKQVQKDTETGLKKKKVQKKKKRWCRKKRYLLKQNLESMLQRMTTEPLPCTSYTGQPSVGGETFPARNRAASERNNYIEATLVPSSESVVPQSGALPEIFERQPLTDQLTRQRISALKLISFGFLGHWEPQFLVKYLNATQQLKVKANTEITKGDERAIQHACQALGTVAPSKITLCPLNCTGALIHRQAVLTMMNLLEPTFQTKVKELFPPKALETIAEEENSQVQEISDLEAFDSHFYLDKLAKYITKKDIHMGSNMLRIASIVKPAKGYEVSIIGGTAVFSNPDTYPSPELVRHLYSLGFAVTVGLNPKKAHLFCNEVEDCLRELLDLPEVAGLGDVGLDFTHTRSTWLTQQHVLQKMLCLARPHHVVLFLCKDKGHVGRDRALSTLQSVAEQFLPRFQKIHLHNFCGSTDRVLDWDSAFDNVYYGFSRLLIKMTPEEKMGVRTVRFSRLLLETDAPYYTFPKHKVRNCSSPSLLGMVAQLAANVLQAFTWQEVLQLATNNALRLYRPNPDEEIYYSDCEVSSQC